MLLAVGRVELALGFDYDPVREDEVRSVLPVLGGLNEGDRYLFVQVVDPQVFKLRRDGLFQTGAPAVLDGGLALGQAATWRDG